MSLDLLFVCIGKPHAFFDLSAAFLRLPLQIRFEVSIWSTLWDNKVENIYFDVLTQRTLFCHISEAPIKGKHRLPLSFVGSQWTVPESRFRWSKRLCWNYRLTIYNNWTVLFFAWIIYPKLRTRSRSSRARIRFCKFIRRVLRNAKLLISIRLSSVGIGMFLNGFKDTRHTYDFVEGEFGTNEQRRIRPWYRTGKAIRRWWHKEE